MKKNAITLFVILTFSCLSYGMLEAADFKISAGIGLNNKHTQFKSLEVFKSEIEKNSGGRISVELYHSSQLGDDREMIEALQVGTQEVTCPTSSVVSLFVNGFKVFDLPFLFPTYESADYVLDGPIGKSLLDQLGEKGLVGLAYWEAGYRNLTNSLESVTAVRDVKGMKVRVMQTPIHMAIWKQLGANPTPMAWGELYSALQQKVVDAMENSWDVIYEQNLFEVQKFATDTGHVYTPFILLMSKKFWDKLPQDLKDVVSAAAIKARDFNRKETRKKVYGYLDKLKEKMEVTILTKEQKEEFFQNSLPVYDQFSKEIGEQLINDVKKTISDFKNM